MVKIKPITLEIEEKVWNKWKETIPRTITLSQAIENLIIKDLRDDKNARNIKSSK